MLRTISHNVRSLRQPEAIEIIIACMQASHVEAYCMQETWLGGSEVKTNKGYTIVLVNDPDAKRRGVGIVLSKGATKAWDAAGRKQCTPSTRVLAIRLEYTDAKGKTVGVCLVSAYRPTSGAWGLNRCLWAMAGVSRKMQHVQHISSAELALININNLQLQAPLRHGDAK